MTVLFRCWLFVVPGRALHLRAILVRRGQFQRSIPYGSMGLSGISWDLQNGRSTRSCLCLEKVTVLRMSEDRRLQLQPNVIIFRCFWSGIGLRYLSGRLINSRRTRCFMYRCYFLNVISRSKYCRLIAREWDGFATYITILYKPYFVLESYHIKSHISAFLSGIAECWYRLTSVLEFNLVLLFIFLGYLFI